MQGRVIEFILLFQNQTKIRIQFIFARRNANIPYILYTFDLDIVQVAYNGRQIISVCFEWLSETYFGNRDESYLK